MVEKECDNCKKKTERKYLGKIRRKLLCKKCRKEVREIHRDETINEAGIGQELISLEKKIKNEAQRRHYRKINPVKERKEINNETPVPKGSTSGKLKQGHKSESYLGFQESQILLKILMKRGLDFSEAKEEVSRIKKQLRETREKLRKQNKSEEQIKIKTQELLEELWRI